MVHVDLDFAKQTLENDAFLNFSDTLELVTSAAKSCPNLLINLAGGHPN